MEADEIIARIETDKVTVDILAAHTGVITKWHTGEGDTVQVGDSLCDIDTDAKAGSAPPKAAATPAAEPKKVEAAPAKVSLCAKSRVDLVKNNYNHASCSLPNPLPHQLLPKPLKLPRAPPHLLLRQTRAPLFLPRKLRQKFLELVWKLECQ